MNTPATTTKIVCPLCHEPVNVPTAGYLRGERYCCPLCHGEFRLALVKPELVPATVSTTPECEDGP